MTFLIFFGPRAFLVGMPTFCKALRSVKDIGRVEIGVLTAAPTAA